LNESGLYASGLFKNKPFQVCTLERTENCIDPTLGIRPVMNNKLFFCDTLQFVYCCGIIKIDWNLQRNNLLFSFMLLWFFFPAQSVIWRINVTSVECTVVSFWSKFEPSWGNEFLQFILDFFSSLDCSMLKGSCRICFSKVETFSSRKVCSNLFGKCSNSTYSISLTFVVYTFSHHNFSTREVDLFFSWFQLLYIMFNWLVP